MLKKNTLYLFKIVIINPTDNTYKDLVTYESNQPIVVNKGDLINPRGFTIEYGFDIFKIVEIEHMVYERDDQLIHSITAFINQIEKSENPISRWTYQHEKKRS